jgi:taurine dioxygenase
MLEFAPLSPEIGVQVSGLDFEWPISAEDAAALKEALNRKRILLFRGGPISEAQQIGVMRALGAVVAETPGSDSPVTWVGPERENYVGGTYKILWHADLQFTPSGALQAISLNAIEMERDEPTLFADQVRAARVLPDDLRAKIRGLEILQCVDVTSGDDRVRCRLSNKPEHAPMSRFPCSAHPLLGPHRVTGEDMLNHSQLFTSHIVGMSDAESDAIFAELEPYQYEESAIYRHHWQVDDLLIWDNIALQHSRDAIGQPFGRKLRRVSINREGNGELMSLLRAAGIRI